MIERRDSFESLIQELFIFYGYNILKQSRSGSAENHQSDFVAEIDNEEYSSTKKAYSVETKLFYQRNVSPKIIIDTLRKMSVYSYLNGNDDNFIHVAIFGNVISDEVRRSIISISEFKNTYVIDIANLLYLCEPTDSLKERLLALINFSVADIIPEKPVEFLELPIGIGGVNDTEEYINELKIWNSAHENKAKSNRYEKICTEILRYLFVDELALWKNQKDSNDGLYRFDLICRIKLDVTPELWNVFQTFLNTKYIIFEFKNYSEKITQSEVYTTEKYLYTKALRSIAFIISNHGPDRNAVKAAKGAFRENGKLVLMITNNDLLEMVKIKENGGVPSDYLFQKVFEPLLIELEK